MKVFKAFVKSIKLKQKPSKFARTLDNIRIKKIISVPIWATKLFLGFQLY